VHAPLRVHLTGATSPTALAAATPACSGPSEKTAQPGIGYAPTMAIVDYDCLIDQLEGQKW
jgi:hypothetical protein